MQLETNNGHLTADQRTIEAQARHISTYRNALEQKDEYIDRLKMEFAEKEADALMYRKIQEVLKEEPTLQGIWDELVVAMKLLGVKF